MLVTVAIAGVGRVVAPKSKVILEGSMCSDKDTIQWLVKRLVVVTQSLLHCVLV